MDRQPSLAVDQLAAFLALAVPWLNFLRHNGYPLLSGEAAVIFTCLAVLAAGLGLFMNRGFRGARPLTLVVLITLMVDVQTEWITTIGLRLLLVVLVLSLLAYLLRGRQSQMAALILGVMALVTVLLPGAAVLQPRSSVRLDQVVADPNLPLVLHIVLDEHIGVEGIPREFDPEGELAARIKEGLLAQGFQVYGRAYSRYYHTYESLSNLLNFSASARRGHFFPGGFQEGAVLAENAWFAQLLDQGYRLHVLDGDYVRLWPAGGRAPEEATGHTVFPAKVGALHQASISFSDRLQQIAATYARLSYFLDEGYQLYGNLRRSSLGRQLGLPAWDRHARRISTLSARLALEQLKQDLHGAGPGQMVFAHILLPHGPYGLTRDCRLRPDLPGWLDFQVPALKPRQNTAETRRERYPHYLEQLECAQSYLAEVFDVLRERGLWDEAIILVHSDHGSRLDLGPPKYGLEDSMTGQDFLDAYSSLFAIKLPGQPAAYQTDQLPIDYLFASLLRTGGSPVPPPAAPQVFCQTRGDSLRILPLPIFRDGRPEIVPED